MEPVTRKEKKDGCWGRIEGVHGGVAEAGGMQM